MDPFSVRQGYRPKAGQQKSSVDARLKWRIWNLIEKYGMDERAFKSMWYDWCGWPVERLQSKSDWRQGRSDLAHVEIKKQYDALETKEWYRVYDLIECVHAALPSGTTRDRSVITNDLFTNDVNVVLSEENSTWRLAQGRIVPHMGVVDHEQIETAAGLHEGNELYAKRALGHMGPGSNNDLSISESIKILENTLRRLNMKGKNIDAMLKNTEKKLKIDPKIIHSAQLVNDFANAHARHANYVSTYRVNEDDARLVLSWCSAVASYLTSRSSARSDDGLAHKLNS